MKEAFLPVLPDAFTKSMSGDIPWYFPEAYSWAFLKAYPNLCS